MSDADAPNEFLNLKKGYYETPINLKQPKKKGKKKEKSIEKTGRKSVIRRNGENKVF